MNLSKWSDSEQRNFDKNIEPNIVAVRAPLTICGDIHFQFHDLIELFCIEGRLAVFLSKIIKETNYLFLGDYVDRDYQSVETFNLILCIKIGIKIPVIDTVDQIEKLNRIQDIPYDGAIYDLLWSDPEKLK